MVVIARFRHRAYTVRHLSESCHITRNTQSGIGTRVTAFEVAPAVVGSLSETVVVLGDKDLITLVTTGQMTT